MKKAPTYLIRHVKPQNMWYVIDFPYQHRPAIGKCHDKKTAEVVLAALLIGVDIRQVVYKHAPKYVEGVPTLVLRKLK